MISHKTKPKSDIYPGKYLTLRFGSIWEAQSWV